MINNNISNPAIPESITTPTMGTQQPSFIFPLVLGSFTAVSYVFLVAVYTVQPTPFIDEAFHVPQAQKYCDGRFNEVGVIFSIAVTPSRTHRG